MWRGSELLSSATHQEALLIALCLGLKSAAALGLGSGGTLVLLGPSTKLVQTVRWAGRGAAEPGRLRRAALRQMFMLQQASLTGRVHASFRCAAAGQERAQQHGGGFGG